MFLKFYFLKKYAADGDKWIVDGEGEKAAIENENQNGQQLANPLLLQWELETTVTGESD